MRDGGEGSRDFAANFLRGRVVGDEFRVQRLDFFRATVQFIELGVGNRGRVLLVIGIAILANEVGKLLILVPQALRRRCSLFCD